MEGSEMITKYPVSRIGTEIGTEIGIEREIFLSRHYSLDGTGGGGITSLRLSPDVPPSVPRNFPSTCAPDAYPVIFFGDVIIPAGMPASVMLCSVSEAFPKTGGDKEAHPGFHSCEWVYRVSSLSFSAIISGYRNFCGDFEHDVIPYGDNMFVTGQMVTVKELCA